MGKMIWHIVTEKNSLVHLVSATPPFGIAFFSDGSHSAGLPLYGIFLWYLYSKAESLIFRIRQLYSRTRTFLVSAVYAYCFASSCYIVY